MGITTAGFYRTIVFTSTLYYNYLLVVTYFKNRMKQDIKNILSEKEGFNGDRTLLQLCC